MKRISLENTIYVAFGRETWIRITLKNFFLFYLSGPAFRDCSIQVKGTIKKALIHLIETLQRVTATAQ